MRYFLLLIGLLLTHSNVFGQFPIPIPSVNELNEIETYFVDSTGKTVFTLPKNHFPVKHSIYDFGRKPDDFNIFNNGIGVIEYKVGFYTEYYWINTKGEILKEFGIEYQGMGKFKNGFCIASKMKEPHSEYFYLNKQGKRAFGDKSFYQVSTFSEGIAAVKATKEGNWEYIDEYGQVALSVKGYKPSEIVKLGSFYKGLALVELKRQDDEYKHRFNYIVIDKEGNTILNIKSLFPERYKLITSVQLGNQINIWMSHYNKEKKTDHRELICLNLKGEKIFNVQKLHSCSRARDNTSYCIEREQISEEEYKETYHFMDKQKGEVHSVVLPKNRKFSYISSFDGFINGEIRYKDKSKRYNCLYDPVTNTEFFVTQGKISSYNDKYFAAQEESTYKYVLKTIDKTSIWETPLDERKFTQINEALKHREKVKYFEVRNESDFSKGLFELENLEALSIISLDIAYLHRQISKLKNLKQLIIKRLPNLKSIPYSLHKLKKLEYLDIKSCTSINTGIEYLIEQSASLKKIVLFNTYVNERYLNQIKRSKPDLKIIGEDYIRREPKPNRIEQDTEIEIPRY